MLNWSKLRGGGHEIALEDIHSSVISNCLKRKELGLKRKEKNYYIIQKIMFPVEI